MQYEFFVQFLQVTALRNSAEITLHHNNIVVGDIIKIKAGMNIPVDGLLIHGSGVQCDESAITGESIEIKKETCELCKTKAEELELDKF